MTDTVHLGLPFIEGSQAQKHVTHNEALRILDAVVQIGVLDTDRTTPPLAPAGGDRHIVASGATGAWSGQADAVAVFEDGTWRFLTPKLGWCAWSDADGALLVYDGAAWTEATGSGAMPGSVAQLGINDTASAPNLLTVRSNAALFNAVAVAGGGTGDIRLQISKEASAKTASLVFSDAFSGRAEFGLIGSDAFKLKVSNDGSTFVEALAIDQSSGNATFPRGLALTGVISPSQITSNQNDYTPTGIAFASVVNLSSDALRSVSGLAGGAEGRIITLINTGSQIVSLLSESASSMAANRFALGSDLAIGAKQAVILRYDGTASRWYAVARPGGREVLTANRTYYVRTDGNDSNDGLTNTSGGAFLTIQRAINVAAGLDLSIYSITIQVADGTYTGGAIVNAPWIGAGDVTLQGNVSTPANVVISTTGVHCISVQNNGRLRVGGVKFQTMTFGIALAATSGGKIDIVSPVNFGACATFHMNADGGGKILCSSNYTISGNTPAHAVAISFGYFYVAGNTITITGSPSLGTFAQSTRTGYMEWISNTFSGSATGARYSVATGGGVFVNGGGTSYLPGNSAGSTTSPGWYG